MAASLTSAPRRRFQRGLLAAAVMTAAGCGFQIRGEDLQLPFKAITISGSGGVVDELRYLISNQPSVRIAAKPAESDVNLIVATPLVERTVVAFSSAGRPREIQLRMKVGFRFTDRFSAELGAPQEITQYRDISVSESEILALSNAESFMVNDMHRDIARQILRRLRAVQLPSP